VRLLFQAGYILILATVCGGHSGPVRLPHVPRVTLTASLVST
jgi:hypothetical protein